MCYLAYLYFEIEHIIAFKSPFFRGNPVRYIFPFLGMDGYLSQNTLTYYIMGEWFTGAIVILYLLFPLLLWLFSKNDKTTFIVVVILYVIFLDKPIVNPESYWSITSCLISFACGMMLMKYKDLFFKKWCAIVCMIGFVGEALMKNKMVDKVFTELSSISYAIFLLQHLTILDVLGAWNPSNPLKIIVLLIGTIILVICQAKALTLVSNAVVKWIDRVVSKVKK